MADIQSFTYDLVTSTGAEAATGAADHLAGAALPVPVRDAVPARPGRWSSRRRSTTSTARTPAPTPAASTHVEVRRRRHRSRRAGLAARSRTPASRTTASRPAAAPGDRPQAPRAEPGDPGLVGLTTRRRRLVVDDDRRRGVFEGAGVASSWTLDVPAGRQRPRLRRDHRRAPHVHVPGSFRSRPAHTGARRTGRRRPQAHERQRPIPLRWLFPTRSSRSTAPVCSTSRWRRGDFPRRRPTRCSPSSSLMCVTTPQSRRRRASCCGSRRPAQRGDHRDRPTPTEQSRADACVGGHRPRRPRVRTRSSCTRRTTRRGSPTASSRSTRSTTCPRRSATRSRREAEGSQR